MLPSEYDWQDLLICLNTVSYALRRYSEEVLEHIGAMRLFGSDILAVAELVEAPASIR